MKKIIDNITCLLGLTIVSVFLVSCQKDSIPSITLKTLQATNVSGNNATVEGEIIGSGGLNIIKRGVCIAERENPTIIDGQAISASSSAQFAVTFSNLIPKRKYYCRAFAECNNIVFYGDEITFETTESVPVVLTTGLFESTYSTAIFGGNVVANGGYEVTSRGIVWNTTGNPSLQNNTGHTTNGTGTGAFVGTLTGLSPQITYYIRAYASNSLGTSYGKEKTFNNGWIQKTSFIEGEGTGHIGFSIGNKGYILSTFYPFDQDYNPLWEYNPASDTWIQKASFVATKRQGHIVLSIGNKAYVGFGDAYYGGEKLKDFWEYDPGTNQWIQKNNFPGKPRAGAFVFTINGRGYIGGGYFSDGYQGYGLNDFWEYNPTSDTWTQMANFAGGIISNGKGFSVENRGFVLVENNINELWDYNAASNKWTRNAIFPGGNRQGSIAFSIGNKAYIGLGMNNDYPSESVVFKDFWEFSPENGSWVRKADFIGGNRSYAFAFAIGNKGFVGGGWVWIDSNSSTFANDLWEFNP